MTTTSKRPKVHVHQLTLDGRPTSVLVPRPSDRLRYSTNYFHGTWHIVTDVRSARFLARCCWALAFQRRPTVMVFDQRFLVPNPFDADPSEPIAIFNTDRTVLSRSALDQLRARLPLMSDATSSTARLHDHGLAEAVADPDHFFDTQRTHEVAHRRDLRGWVDSRNGIVMLAAPPYILRWWGIWAADVGDSWYRGQNVVELDYSDQEGEIQVLEHFDDVLRRAKETRQRLYPDRELQRLTDDEREQVWRDPKRVERALDRRKEAGDQPK